jgi:hypothetical protein
MTCDFRFEKFLAPNTSYCFHVGYRPSSAVLLEGLCDVLVRWVLALNVLYAATGGFPRAALEPYDQ